MTKKLLWSLLLGVGLPCFGQGSINFSNNGDSLITEWGSPMFPNTGFVQLLWAPSGTQADPWFGQSLSRWLSDNPGWQELYASIRPLGPVAGRFLGGTVTLPTMFPGARVEAIVAAWRGNYFSFDAAMAAGGLVGMSEPFSVATGNPTITPPGLPASITGPNGFKGLDLAVPEPTGVRLVLIALLAFGSHCRFTLPVLRS